MIRFLQDPHFAASADPKVSHAFFTRAGGVSMGLYEGLNCGPLSVDEPAHVHENRSRAAAALGVPPACLLTLRQTHSALCHTVEGPWEGGESPEGDALVTDRPGLALGVLTADCAPVLFAGSGERGPVIGAAHAGWKGALGGVLESTVHAMIRLGANPESIRAVIGPCIGAASYGVGADFRDPFLAEDAGNALFFIASEGGGFHFDLPAYCRRRLAQAGVRDVRATGNDTCAEEKDFYSFRRATLRNEPDYGRGLSAVLIRP